ncbi:hypothetical protein GCE86_26575 [Micromonospora terminaliae]|uniref:Uncharacterized protein n=1 Tax=Micromonospora terminaliae TaxID=1914461 RepID=A0AAJ2ZAH5_9ACTN|nr:hypothetical protein [Micromonospora terminaliae]NES26070.1 hypothetical protein [Micromonospora terminaliae]QGL50271.1 hypothetical protein GCE86_26575 [Micromonospora terminaliae]
MTYQQLFDDLIGESPVSTVDVERVIGRQRRARRLRIGAGTTAVAAAVVAVVVGASSLFGTPHAAPAPVTTRSPAPDRSPTSTDTVVAGSAEDLARVRDAVTDGLRRELPELAWITGIAGKDSPKPVISDQTARGGAGVYRRVGLWFRIGQRAGRLSVQLNRNGAEVWANRPPCPTRGLAARECTSTERPDGTKIRSRRLMRFFDDTGRLAPKVLDGREVEVLRPDGTLISIWTQGVSDVTTPDLLVRLALAPDLVFPPLGADPDVNLIHPQNDEHYEIVSQDVPTIALGQAVADVSPGGLTFLQGVRGATPTGPAGHWMWFGLQRGGLRGEGEIRIHRLPFELSCDNLADLSRDQHSGHAHSGQCAATVGADGNRLITLLDEAGSGITYSVFVQRRDGVLVEALVTNRMGWIVPPMPGGEGDAWRAIRNAGDGPAPPLSPDQLAALATHPDLLGLLP